MVLLNLFGGKKEKMSDIEYLAVQESLGNIKRMSGDISSLGEKLTHAVPDGKDAYVLAAKITPSGLTDPAIGRQLTPPNRDDLYDGPDDQYNITEAKISIDSIEKDRAMVGVATSAYYDYSSHKANGYGSLDAVTFDAAIGAKVEGKKTVEIENILSHGNCMAQLACWRLTRGHPRSYDPRVLLSDYCHIAWDIWCSVLRHTWMVPQKKGDLQQKKRRDAGKACKKGR